MWGVISRKSTQIDILTAETCETGQVQNIEDILFLSSCRLSPMVKLWVVMKDILHDDST